MKKFHWTLFVLFLVAAAFIAAPTLNRILAGMQAEASLAEDVVAQETAVSQTTASSDEEFMDITIVGKNGQEHKDLSAYNRIGTIYIGDSRTVGMDDVLDLENIEEDTFVVAKVGAGLCLADQYRFTAGRTDQKNKIRRSMHGSIIINLGGE